MRVELEATGHPAMFAIMNIAAAKDGESAFVDRTSFPLFQDEDSVNAAATMLGHTDDMYIFDASGHLSLYMPVSEGPHAFDMSDPANYDAIKNAILSAE